MRTQATDDEEVDQVEKGRRMATTDGGKVRSKPLATRLAGTVANEPPTGRAD
ncbi:MAG: hypothetical protein U0625_00095 [Phycisphaerales bacterium]